MLVLPRASNNKYFTITIFNRPRYKEGFCCLYHTQGPDWPLYCYIPVGYLYSPSPQLPPQRTSVCPHEEEKIKTINDNSIPTFDTH